MTGTLYIVATPIGNLEDITLRALRILKEVDLILAEDTRVTKRLTTHYLPAKPAFSAGRRGSLHTPIKSYHQHSSDEKKKAILSRLSSGQKIALVTDAGTPGISDPGNELIDFILKNSNGILPPMRIGDQNDNPIRIIPIPGASALTTALSVSGMNVNKFVFLGFLPKRKRNKLFGWLKEGKITFAFYESPYRILKTLDVLEEYFSKDTEVFIARELTKLHETLYRGTIGEVKGKLSKGKVKGEIIVVVSR